MSTFRIGRAPDNDLVFDDASVEPYHAQIVKSGDTYIIEDLGSAAGTFVNGKKVTRAQVTLGQQVHVGSKYFVLSREHLGAGPSVAISRPMATVNVDKGNPRANLPQSAVETAREGISAPIVVTIGAAADNDIVVEGPQISGHHCKITHVAGRYLVTDLKSTNGTFVNAHRVDGSADIQLNDELRLGSHLMHFNRLILKHFDQGSSSTQAMDASAAQAMIAAQKAKMKEGGGAIISVGRADDNDVVIGAPQVSGYHCEIRHEGDNWWVIDLDSTNGTYINKRELAIVPNREMPIQADDVLFLGSYRMPMAKVRERERARDAGDDIVIPLDKDVIVFGRDEEVCDVVLDATTVSRKHAELRKVNGQWFIHDLKSANGTFVNGERITGERQISSSDELSFGSYLLKIDLDSGRLNKEYQGEIMLRAEGLTVEVPDGAGGTKRILDEVSFTAYPTEFIGLMGPSGAGKTTLLMALNGYMVPTKGQSLINNVDLYKHYNSFRGNIGYVPQDDIIHKELTVFESLYYTAKLRLPNDTTDAEIESLIDNILEDLGIADTKNVLIGSPLKKGISGGQRKRVNLAQELLTQPSLLFLDEPTSGLASSDTIGVMKLLRDLANNGRSIILTIHQPSLEVYQEMDNVLYLAKGKLMYYGPTHPD